MTGRAVQVVGAALPEVIRKRQQRKAAYVVSSRDASTWMPLVQAHRHAPTLRLTNDQNLPQVPFFALLEAWKSIHAESWPQEDLSCLALRSRHTDASMTAAATPASSTLLFMLLMPRRHPVYLRK